MIYFIRKGIDGPIKIGFTSSSVEKRIAQLQTGHHEKLYLLGTITGSISDEISIHKELSNYHIHGEWFESKPELLMTISDVIENKREWYYFRQVKLNKLVIECKELRLLVVELREKNRILENEKELKIKLERTNSKLLKRIDKLTAELRKNNPQAI